MNVLLRFLATGDIQAHPFRQFSHIRDDGMNSRLANILSVFDKMSSYALEKGIRQILINGDWFEESDYHLTDVFNAVYMKVAEMKESGLMIAANLGNHDILRWIEGQVVPVHTLVPFMHVAKVIQWPAVLWDHLFVVPYMSAEKVKEAIKKHTRALQIGEREGECRIESLIFHGGVQGARAGPAEYLVRNKLKLKDLKPDKWKLVLLSDYHTTQYLAGNVLYLGSPIQHSFGETHSPGFWDVTLYDKEPWYKLKKIKTHLPRFIRMEISSVKELEDVKEKLAGNYVSVSLLSRGLESGVESFAKAGGFDIRIRQYEDAREPDSKKIWLSATSPADYIAQFVRRKTTRSSRRKSLIRLGQALYEGKEQK